MGRGRLPSLESVSGLIAAVHEASVDGTGWPVALRRLGDLFHAPRATIWMQDKAGGYQAMHTMEPDDRITRDYAEHYGRLDHMRPAVISAPAAAVLTSDMVMPRAEFMRTEFHAGFAAPHGLNDAMVARVFDGARFSSIISVLGASRSSVFEREHVRLMTLLLPHLGQAMRTQFRLACLGVERDSALQVLDTLRHGVLVVDVEACVLHANRAAEELLCEGQGLGVEPASCGRRLRAATPRQTEALRRLIVQAVAGRWVGDALPGTGGTLRLDHAAGEPLLVSVAPLRDGAAWNVSPRPAAFVLIGKSEGEAVPASPAHLRALYGLTAAEAAVARRIVRGEGVKDAAEALGMAPSTLRWHLRTVFDKTGTARQAELARLVERLGAMAGHNPGWPG